MLVTLDIVVSCTYLSATQILIHPTLLFHIYGPRIHKYIILLDTVISYICTIAIWIICTQLYHIHVPLLHRSTGILTQIVSVLLLHESQFILHELLLDEYSCIPITWLFPVIDIDILITGHVNCWYAMCGTKCHVDSNHGATSESYISCFPFPVILFYTINRVHVLLSC